MDKAIQTEVVAHFFLEMITGDSMNKCKPKYSYSQLQ